MENHQILSVYSHFVGSMVLSLKFTSPDLLPGQLGFPFHSWALIFYCSVSLSSLSEIGQVLQVTGPCHDQVFLHPEETPNCNLNLEQLPLFIPLN